jgi:hypothetical protein
MAREGPLRTDVEGGRGIMPAKGWRTVNLREEVYEKLEKKAKKENRNVTNMAETIILEAVQD